MSSEIEKKVIERFVVKTKHDRYLTFLKNEKTRKKFTKELSHFRELRLEHFEEVKGDVRKIIKDRISHLGNIKNCYLISENVELDRKTLDIETALNETIGYRMGTFIVFGNADIVYYEAEGPNERWISKPIKL